MEIKKSPKASLENKKTLFREIGLVLSLLIVLGAFEWSTTEQSEIEGFEDTQVVVEEEQVPITQEEQLPPPEAPKEPVISDIIDIVDDDVKVEEFVITTEDDKNLAVDIVEYVDGGQEAEEEVVEEIVAPATEAAIDQETPTVSNKSAMTTSASFPSASKRMLPSSLRLRKRQRPRIISSN